MTRTNCVSALVEAAFLCEVQEAGGWRFHWPRMQDGAMHLTSAQFSALFEGLDWKRVHAPSETRAPTKAG
ncbi:IS66 family insertion sequence element accessory protein TnpB [Rhizobium beringeri]|uniref:IS66 family insertion sequence element accessory protein TnpB n=1 Tax=Rhizobium beringeri TaxID=3019934 RepID=UPI0012DB2B89